MSSIRFPMFVGPLVFQGQDTENNENDPNDQNKKEL